MLTSDVLEALRAAGYEVTESRLRNALRGGQLAAPTSRIGHFYMWTPADLERALEWAEAHLTPAAVEGEYGGR
jgi:hypothetical protein